MTAAFATSPPPTPDATNPPKELGRVLALVCCLIEFGRGLAESLRQRTGAIHDLDFRFSTGLFGTTDIATALLRIARGLRRAAALHALLLARAKRGRELKVTPVRISLPRARSVEPREPRAKRPPLPLEPSDEEIVADVRRRPVGAVMVEICLDLGVLPSDLGRDRYQELTDVVMFYGGNLIRMLRMDNRVGEEREAIAILRSDAPLPPEFQPFPVPFAEMAEFAAATGPP